MFELIYYNWTFKIQFAIKIDILRVCGNNKRNGPFVSRSKNLSGLIYVFRSQDQMESNSRIVYELVDMKDMTGHQRLPFHPLDFIEIC